MMEAVRSVAKLREAMAGDKALSIVFVVLGLGFLAGGAYAIVEGWPYLLIERGFTLVIIGTVLMTAGVVMLALWRVMAEIHRVRSQLSNAVMTLSLASMTAAPDIAQGVVPSRGGASEDGAMPASNGGVPIGTAVLAGGALAAGTAALAATRPSSDRDEKDLHPVVSDASHDDEPDLFVTPDLTATDHSSAREKPAEAPTMPEPDALLPVQSELRKDWTDSDALGDADARDDVETAPLAVATPDEFEAALAAATADERMPAPRIDEDFDRLRDHLAAELDRTSPDGIDETPLRAGRSEPEEPDLAGAADWMTAVRPGRDRWFSDKAADAAAAPAVEAQVKSEAEPESESALAWPPQAREALPFEPDAAHGSEHREPLSDALEPAPHEPEIPEPAALDWQVEDRAPEGQSPVEPEPLPVFILPPEPVEPEPDPESQLEPEPAKAPAESPPAASEEGVVGAYQVGTAHFTIYADGSIKARTPEGDYSFASMDELKIYLASEKSRIGV